MPSLNNIQDSFLLSPFKEINLLTTDKWVQGGIFGRWENSVSVGPLLLVGSYSPV